MKLSYYNDEVDKIMWDMIGNDSFQESDKSNLVDIVTETIHQYDTHLTKENLKLVIEFLIDHKYQKYYIYDLNSDFNKVAIAEKIEVAKKVESSARDLDEDSDTMSLDADDLIETGEDTENNATTTSTAKYINPELGAELPDKINLNSANDLISHRHDYQKPIYKEATYIKRKTRVSEIKKIPQHEQKSAGWLKQRNECLTATAIATVLDEDPYKYPIELLFDKCGKGTPFIENENVHHGKKYEQIGNMFYCFRNNISVAEYGLLQHEKYSFIGASPDGICDKNTMQLNKLSKLVGRLLEIKFPKIRKICIEGDLDGEICPHYYFLQVLTQLFVTGLDECDFLQCKIEEYESWKDFVDDSNPNITGLSKKTNLEKGCLIQLLPKKMIGTGDPNMCLYNAKYIYPPKLHMTNQEIESWISTEVMNFHKHDLSNEYMIDRIIYWRLSEVACHLIKADTEFFESIIPVLKQFWDYILFYRQNSSKLDKLVNYVKELSKNQLLDKDGFKKSSEIFARVHKDYMSVNKDSKYTALYQEESEWRKKYDKKHAGYQKFAEYQKNKQFYADKKKQ